MPCFPVKGDLQLTADGKRFVVAAGPAALAQRINIGLQTPLGTWRWDKSQGVPFLTNQIEKLTPTILRAMLRRYLLSFSEVTSILTLDVQTENGNATVTYSLMTNVGIVSQESVQFLVVNR